MKRTQNPKHTAADKTTRISAVTIHYQVFVLLSAKIVSARNLPELGRSNMRN